ncbi:hypothetical protein [Alkalibacillus haloalkaliphilus]|uniref:Lipoprotein n=1 Tax=Alkalibacillus haloalkaliphilus TaxID=94136 RepID=A0A511W091_9BACI|nr:hypothetical protein [Alkalibacillus haloalkaliphilus]GEN44514.1 hypothetical protein AHA02nite_02900 [Alkalibacillus haloalkaliphilus]
MKTIKVLLTGLIMVALLVACTMPPEAQELVDYHNDIIDFTEEKGEEMDEIDSQMTNMSLEEAYELQLDEMLPIADEILEYVNAQSPESDIVVEYHDMRSAFVEKWYEAVYEELDVYGQFINDEITEDEFNMLLSDVEAMYIESAQLLEEAEDRLADFVEEYDLEELE